MGKIFQSGLRFETGLSSLRVACKRAQVNFSACRILSVSSAQPYLLNISVDGFSFCSKFNIKLIPQWITGEQNELADYYSRIKDTDNWSIDNDSFRLINDLYGPFAIGRFANNSN